MVFCSDITSVAFAYNFYGIDADVKHYHNPLNEIEQKRKDICYYRVKLRKRTVIIEKERINVMTYKYTIRTENESVFTNLLEFKDTFCWIEELKALYRVLEEDSDLQPDAIAFENERQLYRLCKIGNFKSNEMAFDVMKYNAVKVAESLKEMETLYGDLMKTEDDSLSACKKLESPKTYLACYMFLYFGGDIFDGKVIDGAGIDVAFRPYKNGMLVQFHSEAETCFEVVNPSRIIECGRKETIYFSDLVQVSYSRRNCYKLVVDEELTKMMCDHFGWDRIDIQVESFSLSYKESEYMSSVFECSRDVFEDFLKAHPDDFDITDNKNAQCPAYGWVEK